MCVSLESGHKYLVELIGTFLLTLAVIFSIYGVLGIAISIIAAFILGLWVYLTGHISGAHINPAITMGALAIKKIGVRDAVAYMIAQFAGAILAMFVASSLNIANYIPLSTGLSVGVAEFLGMVLFAFGVASVIYGQTSKGLSGAVIGTSLFFGIFFAGSVSNGVLNPAVALGIDSFNLAYILGPLLGAAAGMFLFKFLSGEK